MKKIIAHSFNSVSLIFSLAYFMVAIILIFGLSYFLGHELLEGIMMGSDSAFALTVMNYLAKWFPRVPFWYPYQGAGQSMTLGYYALTYYVPIILERLSTLDLVQSMRLVAFLTVPIIGVEIFIYCWGRLKNQTIGLIAGLLYPLSAASWAWMTHGGFYAMSLSLVFIIPAFGFYDWYLSLKVEKSKSKVKRKLALLFAVIFIGLALASHLAVGAATLLGMGFYTLFRSQLNPLKIPRKKSVFVAIGALIIVVILGLGFSSFAFIPQRHYTNQIAEDIIPVYGPDIPQLELPAFLGIKRFDPMFDSIYQPMFLSIAVTAFAGVGLVMGLLKRHFIGGLALATFILAFITSITKWINGLSHFWAVIMLPTNVRLAAFVFVTVPIIAAYGAWSVGELPFLVIKKALSWLGLKKERLYQILVFLPVSLISFVIVYFGMRHYLFYQRWPQREYNEFAYSGFGPMGVITSFCLIPELKMQPPVGFTCEDLKPTFSVSSIGRDPLPEMKFDDVLERFGIGQFTRTDVSTHLGLLTASANLHTDASMINSYNGIGALIYVWWGHETRAMFLEGNFTSDNVEEMAKYFGIQYIFLHAGDDAGVFYRYPEDKWKTLDAYENTIAIKEYKEATGLVTRLKRPVILVIGTREKDAYEQIFRLAYSGGLSIDDGLIVEGRERVDDYKLDELSRFDAVVLHGYSYKSRSKAFNLLESYVNQGGSVFVDTGWQFVAEDWGRGVSGKEGVFESDLSEPFPIKKTTWGNIGTSWIVGKLNPDFSRGITLTEFAPPVWENVAWNMAIASKDDLAPWAKPVLSVGDTVVIAAGEYGKGKVVWSGMNIFAHANDKASKEEYKFVSNLFDYLLPDREVIEGKVGMSRTYPDEINFTVVGGTTEPTWLYFREAYTRDWNPKLVLGGGKKAKVDIYKAGPGLTLLYLPPLTSVSELTLKYSLGWTLPASIAITFVTFMLLILLLIDSAFLHGKWEKEFIKHIPLKKIKLPKMEKILGHEDE